MTLDEIVYCCKDMEIFELRVHTNEYVELVLLTEQFNQWKTKFLQLLGLPIKPLNSIPSEEHIKITRLYGGIRKDQIFYKKDYKNDSIMAMFWPWSNGIYVTLKLIKVVREDAPLYVI